MQTVHTNGRHAASCCESFARGNSATQTKASYFLNFLKKSPLPAEICSRTLDGLLKGGDEATHQRSVGAVVYCSRFLLTRALRMTSSHSEGLITLSLAGFNLNAAIAEYRYGRSVEIPP